MNISCCDTGWLAVNLNLTNANPNPNVVILTVSCLLALNRYQYVDDAMNDESVELYMNFYFLEVWCLLLP